MMNYELDKHDNSIIDTNIEREISDIIASNPNQQFSDASLASARATARKVWTTEILAKKYGLEKTEKQELFKSMYLEQ